MKKVDRKGHDALYKNQISRLANAKNAEEYLVRYSALNLRPFYDGGTTKGFVRGRAVQQLFHSIKLLGMSPTQTTILDAGCGQGELSVYLACKGYQVIGVDISPVACASAQKLANKFGIGTRCTFLAESLEHLSLADNSIDFILGHASLHHFIKYNGVPEELARVLKNGGEGYFADSFGENRVYHWFHDKEKMKRLGDVPLNRWLINRYFSGYFYVVLTPMDWFTMLDKLFLKIIPRKFEWRLRKLSKIYFAIDRKIPISSPLSLYLSGSVMTTIKKRSGL